MLRTTFLSREPDFQEFLKTCFVGVFWVLQCIFWHCSTSEPRTGFLSREPDFQEILEKPQNMFSWCFLGVSCFFSIVRHLSREPDFWAENSVFKTFFKSVLTCLGGVFWMLHGILALFDIWAENRILSQEPCFYKFRKMTLNMYNQHAINCR